MAIELKVPSAGESITEVVVVEWLKQEGAHADRDEPVALLETDKANMELLAPVGGTVSRILKKAGDPARVGEVIGLIEPEVKGAESKPAKGSTGEAPVRAVSAATTAPAPAPTPPTAPEAPKSPAPRAEPRGENMQAQRAVPPSKRRAQREKHDGAPAAATPASPQPPAPPPPREVKAAGDHRPTRTVPMTPLRRRVAERLVEAQNTAAMLTTFNEVDMSNVMALRKEHQDAFKQKYGIKLGFMSFFVKASIEGLKAFPAINAEIRGNDLVYHDYYDIGVAVGGGKGLVVPVIRSAERRSFAEIEKTIADFGERAKAGRLKVEELEGGTFTISNGGIYGSMMSTPILNPPQSGILGMHAIQERPVARQGAVAIAPMMYVALTYDHRIVDGREAVSFLVRMKECIENPARILLEV